MWWLIILLAVIAVLWLFFQWLQLRILFQPTTAYIWSPPEHKDFAFRGITGWIFRFHDQPYSKWMLHCHGNSGNISHLRHIISLCQRQGLNLLVFDYRGYGKSPGRPSPKRICEDGEAAYEYLTQHLEVAPERIVVWGESLGGAVATHVASKHPASVLVLVATFSSIDDIIHDSYPGIISSCFCFVLRAMVNCLVSKDKIDKVKCAVVVLHSREDEVIPFPSAERMYQRIPHSCKRFIEVTGYHASPKLTPDVLEDIMSFCCTDTSQCYAVCDLLEEIGRGHPRAALLR